MTKQDYKIGLEIVREEIHRIDPYSLLEGGCPEDEFDSEIASIANQLTRCKSGKDVAHAITRVLNSSFGEKHKPSEFEDAGTAIFEKLHAKDLI